MRNSTIVAALALAIAPALLAAQATPLPTAVAKGSKLISGSAQLARSSFDGGDATATISLSPSVLFFVADRFAAGGELTLARTSAEGFTSNAWTLGPVVRYFFTTSSAKTLPFIGASLGIGRTKSESSGSEFKAEALSAEAVAGITWLLNDYVGVNAESFFRSSRQETTALPSLPASEITQSVLGVRFGVSAFIR